jgi:hypothetical protein
MNLFFSLKPTKSSAYPLDVYDYGLALTTNEVSINSFYFITPYKAVDYPEVNCDKTYFFVYSTDHDDGAGAIWWGKGNNLDLSDFQELGLITTGYQSETPVLMKIPTTESGLQTDTIFMYYHTGTDDPANTNAQETRLLTCAGGDLHTASWTDRGNPLGLLEGESHTGYFRIYKRGANDYIGTHITFGGLSQEWKYSTSTDGLTFVRGPKVDVRTSVNINYFAQPSDGMYFKYNGIQYWIGNAHPRKNSGIFDIDRKLILTRMDNGEFGKMTELDVLNNGTVNLRHGAYIENGIAHIYATYPTVSNSGGDQIYYGKYDLRNINQY